MFPNIKAEQARHNLSNQNLASKLGVSDRTITNWMNGKTEIPASKLLAMSRIFSCTIDYLLSTDTPVAT